MILRFGHQSAKGSIELKWGSIEPFQGPNADSIEPLWGEIELVRGSIGRFDSPCLGRSPIVGRHLKTPSCKRVTQKHFQGIHLLKVTVTVSKEIV